MFNFLKKKGTGSTVTFKIKGMHCMSCAINIDGALEDTEGVLSAETKYATAKTVVNFDPAKVSSKKIKSVIKSLDYSIEEDE